MEAGLVGRDAEVLRRCRRRGADRSRTARRGSGCAPDGRSRAGSAGRAPALGAVAGAMGDSLAHSARSIAQLLLAHVMLRICPATATLARNHDFTVLWVGQTISELGSRMSMFVFPLLGLPAHRLRAVAAARRGRRTCSASRCALLPAGVLADRLDRQPADAAGERIRRVALRLARRRGARRRPDDPAPAVRRACSPASVPGSSRRRRSRRCAPSYPTRTCRRRSARTRRASTSPSLLGGPLGGALYGVTRWLPFAVDAVSFAVSWVLLGRIRADLSARAVDGPRSGRGRTSREGLRFSGPRPFFRVLMVLGAADQPDRQRAVLRRDPAADRGRASTRPRSAWSRPRPAPAASSARWSRRG